jgi:hypothetical protein
VLVRDPFVAKVLPHLVDAIEPADDQPLQVELGRDPQVEIPVECVVMGHKRPGQRAAVERLQHRGLDLQEAALVEPLAGRPDGGGALGEELTRLRVGDEVELATAIARLGVLKTVELVRRRAQALRQELPRREAQGELATTRLERRSLHADEVPEIQMQELIEALRTEHIGTGVELQPAGCVDEIQKRRLPVAAAGHQAAGDLVGAMGLLPVGEVRMSLPDGRDLAAPGEVVRERIDP